VGGTGWVGSMGAVTVLLTAAPESPLVQPRNLFGGNIVAAVIGVGFKLLFRGHEQYLWVAAGLAVALSISLMQITKTVHPPAGATAFVAVMGTTTSFFYVLVPVIINVGILFAVCIIIINMSKYMKWPIYCI
jgi:CBS domain-containing membrane protein